MTFVDLLVIALFICAVLIAIEGMFALVAAFVIACTDAVKKWRDRH